MGKIMTHDLCTLDENVIGDPKIRNKFATLSICTFYNIAIAKLSLLFALYCIALRKLKLIAISFKSEKERQLVGRVITIRK